MRILAAAALLAAFAPLGAFSDPARAAVTVSAPLTYENLTVYFVHGEGIVDYRPLMLEDALAEGLASIRETGRADLVEIENHSDQDLFINAGEILKGGEQDRAIAVSLVAPAGSGPLRAPVFSIEQSRQADARDDPPAEFSAAAAITPLRATRLALKGAVEHRAGAAYAEAALLLSRNGDNYFLAQRAVWLSVEETISRLTETLGAPVANAASETSLALALEHDALRAAQSAYTEALARLITTEAPPIGAVFAVNGRVVSADIYASPGLFDAMWPRLLTAAITEALAHRNEFAAHKPASPQVVSAFLEAKRKGPESITPLPAGGEIFERRARSVIYGETRMASGAVAHRSYLPR